MSVFWGEQIAGLLPRASILCVMWLPAVVLFFANRIFVQCLFISF
ncbi:hypothetical protein PORCAN_1660 [Porphyromonas crevioricanis JCM 13913]|nr:hypothetical protein PORCAN_1660 [Porphyromonas crevioricanis JCM 13913]